MNCIKGLTVALILGFIGLLAQLSSAATWYVSTNGNDASAGTSWKRSQENHPGGRECGRQRRYRAGDKRRVGRAGLQPQCQVTMTATADPTWPCIVTAIGLSTR